MKKSGEWRLMSGCHSSQKKKKNFLRKEGKKSALQCLYLTAFCLFSVSPLYYLFTSTNLRTKRVRRYFLLFRLLLWFTFYIFKSHGLFKLRKSMVHDILWEVESYSLGQETPYFYRHQNHVRPPTTPMLSRFSPKVISLVAKHEASSSSCE